MSSNNNGSEVGMAVALVGMTVAVLGVFIFALVSFLVLLLTILALASWNNRLYIGEIAPHPDDARAFVYSGLAGMILLPLFVVFCQLLIGLQFDNQYWIYVFVSGYDLGAIIFLLVPDDFDQAVTTNRQLPATTNQNTEIIPPAQSIPFKYASWDDEEERK